jgi:hypothetical protein
LLQPYFGQLFVEAYSLVANAQFTQAQLALQNGLYPDTASQYNAAPTEVSTGPVSTPSAIADGTPAETTELTEEEKASAEAHAVAKSAAQAAEAAAVYAQQWYEWSMQFYQYHGRWPTQQDWEFENAMMYYGAQSDQSAATAVEADNEVSTISYYLIHKFFFFM